MEGKVKFFDNAKGFGFIKQSGPEGKDVFFHYSGLACSKEEREGITDGTLVEFDIEEWDKGPKAVNVTLV